jgi:hypothetical protein
MNPPVLFKKLRMDVLVRAFVIASCIMVFVASAVGQVGPRLIHPGEVSTGSGWAFIWLEAESQSIQYLRCDVYVAQNTPFKPQSLGSLGTLLIDPGNLVYMRLGLVLNPASNAPWVSLQNFYYPKLPYSFVGTKFKVQVLAHDTTRPGRYALSSTAQTVTMTP